MTTLNIPGLEADVVVTGVERDGLPVGTVALDSNGRPFYKGSGSWVGVSECPALDDYVEFRLRVIWPPSAVQDLRLKDRLAAIIGNYREHFEGKAADKGAAAAILQTFVLSQPVVPKQEGCAA